MNELYLDASAIVPLFIKELRTPLVRRLIAELDGMPVVSTLAAGEVASTLSRLVRMGDVELVDARDRLAQLDRWVRSLARGVDTDAADVSAATDIVRRFELQLLMPDAVHLATCRRLGASLLTFDERLAEAAGTLGVPLLVPA